MKRIILTSAALMSFAAASYAQLIQQNGQQQFARQNQVGINQDGTIQQVQNANNLPNATNYGNYAITFQGTPQNNGANTLFIQQNDGSQGNRAGIAQSGGPGLDARIEQNGGVDGLSGGATSTSATQNARGEDGNFAGIVQVGSSQVARIFENNNSRRNSAETYQNGSGNTAQTAQSNNSVSNSAFVFQGYTGQNIIGTAVTGSVARINQGRGTTGETNPGTVASEAIVSTAVITQTASNATALIDQGGLFGSAGATGGRASNVDARITQSGTGGVPGASTAGIAQGLSGGDAYGSRGVIIQTSANQQASISQANGVGGSDNASIATINQTSTTGGIQGSFAQIVQGQGGSTDSDQATINQTTGVSNSQGRIFQGFNTGSFSSGDQATINQAGNTTTATIFQNTAGGGAESNGRNNTATINQANGVVGVFGTSGLALIYQGLATGGSPIQVNRNTATITQSTGAGLRAAIVQGASAGTPLTDAAGTGIGLTALQGGAVAIAGTITNDNTATISQVSGDNSNANIYQTGRFNTAAITQANGNASRALVVQTSNSERARAIINQTSNSGLNNQATILQFAGSNADGVGGFGNQAIINQTVGSGNIALIQQGTQAPVAGQPSTSNDNIAQITQNGSTNTTRFLQVGNNNFVDVTQNGNNNVLTGAAVGSTFAAQIGYNNRLTLIQNGGTVGLTFRYTQIGNNNTQEVVQNLNP